eukprot:SAG31_NODE_42425_length_271_cov_1.494186_1_plen_25_part_01
MYSFFVSQACLSVRDAPTIECARSS